MTNALDDEAAIEDEMATIMEGLGPTPDYRADVPSGTVLAEQDFGGGTKMRFTKANSKVSMNGQEVSDRFTAYRTDNGREVRLPTVQMGYYLRKRHADGTRVFTRNKQEVPAREPIKETCPVCDEHRGPNAPQKYFYSINDYVQHMAGFHEQEWAAIQEGQRRRDAQAGLETQENLAKAILAAVERLEAKGEETPRRARNGG